MKILLTGAEGQVAHELIRSANPLNVEVLSLTKKQLDITDLHAVSNIIKLTQPELIINAAAYTQVDRAEMDSALAQAVNHDGAKNLAVMAESCQIPLIHFSTDYVFDGEKTTPYCETDSVSPVNAYGRSKWEGEQAVRQYCSRYIILRLSAVFGVTGNNFVKTMLRLSREKEILRVVADQITCPTPARAIAAAVWHICEALETNPAWGTYHFCGETPVSWFHYAETIIAASCYPDKITQQVIAINSSQYPAKAQRPPYSVLDCALIEKTYGIKSANWMRGLQDVITELSTA